MVFYLKLFLIPTLNPTSPMSPVAPACPFHASVIHPKRLVLLLIGILISTALYDWYWPFFIAPWITLEPVDPCSYASLWDASTLKFLKFAPIPTLPSARVTHIFSDMGTTISAHHLKYIPFSCEPTIYFFASIHPRISAVIPRHHCSYFASFW